MSGDSSNSRATPGRTPGIAGKWVAPSKGGYSGSERSVTKGSGSDRRAPTKYPASASPAADRVTKGR